MPAIHRRLAPAVVALALAACGASQEHAVRRPTSPVHAVAATGGGAQPTAAARADRSAAGDGTPALRRTPRYGRIADGWGMTRLSAYGGHLVLSRRDRHAARWRLMHWHAGTLEPLPVAPRAVPFDADAGSDAAGRPVVTYSVCAEDVGPYDPQWRLSTGCRLMVLHLDAPEQPQPLPAADAPGTSVTTPSMWRGNLVFSRHADGGDTSEVLYLPRGASASAPVSLPVPVRPCESECEIAVARTTIESLDLGGRAAVFVSRQEGGATIGIGPEWTLRVAPLDGSKPHDLSTGFVDGACGFIMPVSPTADGIGAFWDATGSACETTETVFAEHHVRTKRRREAQDPDHEVWTAARDATATYWLRGARGKARFHAPDQRACTFANAECVLVRAPRLRWRTLKPGEILGPHPEEY